MISTGTSWINSFSTGISSTNWQSCTARVVLSMLYTERRQIANFTHGKNKQIMNMTAHYNMVWRD